LFSFGSRSALRQQAEYVQSAMSSHWHFFSIAVIEFVRCSKPAVGSTMSIFLPWLGLVHRRFAVLKPPSAAVSRYAGRGNVFARMGCTHPPIRRRHDENTGCNRQHQ